MLLFSDSPEKNGTRVEAVLRKELGAPAPLPYSTAAHGDSGRPASLGAALGEAFTELWKGKDVRPMYTFRFEPTAPRPLEARATVVRFGSVILVGRLEYALTLARPAPAPVEWDPGGVLSRGRFAGDPATAERLSSDRAVLSCARRLLRDRCDVGKDELEGEARLRVEGTRLSVTTMPKQRWFGLATDLGARDFLALAAELERALAR